MTVLTASEARANLDHLIDQAAESRQPKRASAVLVSEEAWQAKETMFLLSVRGMRKSIREAMAEPLASSSKELKW